MGTPNSQVFLLNTRTPWDEPPRARHQLAHALAEKGKVVFVAANSYGRPGLRTIEATRDLTVVVPSWPMHHRRRYRLPLANELYQRWLFPKLARQFRTRFVLNFDHTATHLFSYFADVSYYCNDYHIRNYGSEAVRSYFERSEKTVAGLARSCIATCAYLRDRLSQWNPRSVEVRLGAPEISEAPVRRFAKEEVIRVALVDFLSTKKTSFEILERLSSDPRLRVTAYGPTTPEAKERLRALPGVEWRGVLAGDELRRALAQSDVGIAPYGSDDDNPGRTPNKLWHYLAAGLPCVTTDIPGIREWKFKDGLVYRASGRAAFHEQVLRAHAEDSPEKALRRYQYSQQNTWGVRADEIVRFLEGSG